MIFYILLESTYFEGMERLRGKWKAPLVNATLLESSQGALTLLQPLTFQELYERQCTAEKKLAFPESHSPKEEGVEEFPNLPHVSEDTEKSVYGDFSAENVIMPPSTVQLNIKTDQSHFDISVDVATPIRVPA
jgi:hypothetical protein